MGRVRLLGDLLNIFDVENKIFGDKSPGNSTRIVPYAKVYRVKFD